MNLKAGSETDGLILRSHWAAGGEPWLEVVLAEPKALFAGKLLRLARRGHAFPFTEVDKVGIGGIIRIRARDRVLVYQITERLEQDVYVGVWPD